MAAAALLVPIQRENKASRHHSTNECKHINLAGLHDWWDCCTAAARNDVDHTWREAVAEKLKRWPMAQDTSPLKNAMSVTSLVIEPEASLSQYFP